MKNKTVLDSKDGFYTTGEFARMANVSQRTVRYYDKTGLLVPSYSTASGYRLYTEADFSKLQRILTLKYLGFSLEEIENLTVRDTDADYVKESIRLQKELVGKKIEGLMLVEKALEKTQAVLERGEDVDWKQILNLIHMVNMEKTLVEQYKNGSNLNIRIKLHQQFSVNRQGWFPWICEQMGDIRNKNVLELGCGNGEMWKWMTLNKPEALEGARIVLSDISAGMVNETRKRLGDDEHFEYECFDCAQIPDRLGQMDVILANHVMFYVPEIRKTLEQISRRLSDGGVFICSTYGKEHMKEISQLVCEFDSRIVLSEVKLYEAFGLDNAESELKPFFKKVEKRIYRDELCVTEVMPLLDYIMSCHGNQHDFLNSHYERFRDFLTDKLNKKGCIRITKDAGMFLCYKPEKR